MLETVAASAFHTATFKKLDYPNGLASKVFLCM